MGRLADVLDSGVERGDIPFASAVVTNAERDIWQHATGAFDENRDAQVDSVYVMLSMTKAVGAAAALVLVDRGQLSLDTVVEEVVPEFKEIQVLEDFSASGLVMRPPRTPVRLRHLLTHTSGLTYATYHVKQKAYEYISNCPTFGSTIESFKYPLMFDPGEQFMYGLGPDWVGVLIERVSGLSLDAFCRAEILDPLGMVDTVFEPDGLAGRIAPVTARSADGSLSTVEFAPPLRPETYSVGGALYGTAPDYARFLRLVLNDGQVDGQRILSTSAVETMTQNQIGDLRVPAILTSSLPWSENVELAPGSPATWTTAFLRNEVDLEDMRRAGSLAWAGFLNTHYWVDPLTRIGGVLMTQVMPFCDSRTIDVFRSFEQAVYAELV
ncbi:hypothetical protein ASC77_23675 [Nocardioides sp. Root1257]|uniref:serine hydrolase domain-containing protein n=1 Tax=unclassified Nocardioides TaxID=2615069 RepID=UPI0006F21B84|nr:MULTISPECIES: serine hydrolase [unclassified Nocardioides]KQW42661.1 hypothetical protein ASC77_23675 [Nocardioides sp. Root1257]KRC39919.1 hypothetical protein ASE24_23470 [Nocardioides sp. Root224]